jgi:hypothetical protein
MDGHLFRVRWSAAISKATNAFARQSYAVRLSLHRRNESACLTDVYASVFCHLTQLPHQLQSQA